MELRPLIVAVSLLVLTCSAIPSGQISTKNLIALMKAERLAITALKKPRCRALFGEHSDQGANIVEHAAVYLDGTGVITIDDEAWCDYGYFAWTSVGMQTTDVYLCSLFFDPGTDDRKRAAVLIHESIHLSGVREYPFMTRRIERACGL